MKRSEHPMIIGSCAMRRWFPDFGREPKDMDIVGGPDPVTDLRIERLNNPVLAARPELFEDGYLKPSALLALKLSHLFWDVFWDKHCFDMVWLYGKGVEPDMDLFWDLHAHWTANPPSLGLRRSNLDMTADEFFDNALTCDVPHDDLHEMLSDTPAYKSILVGEVQTSDDLFDALPHGEKIRLVREETMVMAYERAGTRTWRAAYSWMLRRLIWKHLPVRQALWALRHYREIYIPEFDYIDKINNRRNALLKSTTK
jgi:hypothetical protein